MIPVNWKLRLPPGYHKIFSLSSESRIFTIIVSMETFFLPRSLLLLSTFLLYFFILVGIDFLDLWIIVFLQLLKFFSHYLFMNSLFSILIIHFWDPGLISVPPYTSIFAILHCPVLHFLSDVCSSSSILSLTVSNLF